jgi:CRP-like cAMP-binding protein
VIFPCGGMLSAIATMRDGNSIEIVTTGREGVTGLSGVVAALGAPFEVTSSIGGPALQVSTAEFRDAVQNMPVLVDHLQAFIHAVFAQVGQRSACAAWHSIAERYAFRLLVARECTGDNELPITQETIARLLGVWRPKITEVAQDFQRMGLITQERGRIKIIDPHGLEQVACECLPTIRDVYLHRLPWLAASLAKTGLARHRRHIMPLQRSIK